jgi:hypothetical protein
MDRLSKEIGEAEAATKWAVKKHAQRLAPGNFRLQSWYLSSLL